MDLLSAALRLAADQHELSPTAIATRKDLEKLVRGDTDIELLHGWRRTVAGSLLQAVMAGEKTLLATVDGPVLIDAE